MKALVTVASGLQATIDTHRTIVITGRDSG
jgi:hypothetical protein